MALQSTDLILVYDVTASTLKKCQVGNAASSIASNDLLLVERSSVKKKMTYSDWVSSAQDTDLLLVERGGVKKKVTKANYDALLHASQDIFSSIYTPTLDFDYSTVSNSTANWSVLSKQIKVTNSGSSSTGNLYLGCKISASNTFHNDLCIAAIQVLQSNGSSFRADGVAGDYPDGYDWNFHRIDKYGVGRPNAGASAAQFWGTVISPVDNVNIDQDSYVPISNDSNFTNQNSVKSQDSDTWNRNNLTPTSRTGCDAGIYNVSTFSGGGGSILPEGDDNIAQTTAVDPSDSSISGDAYYIFAESSGTTSGEYFWIED